MTAAKFKLDNLTGIIDRNFIQIDGSTEDVMPLEPFADKYRAFNWEVFECDGNDMAAFIETAERAQELQRQAACDHRATRFRAKASPTWKATTRGTASRPTRSRPTKRCANWQRERERILAHA